LKNCLKRDCQKSLSPISEISGKVSITESEDGMVVKVTSVNTKPKEEREYIIAKTSKLAIADEQLIDAGTQLASGYLDIKEILHVRVEVCSGIFG